MCCVNCVVISLCVVADPVRNSYVSVVDCVLLSRVDLCYCISNVVIMAVLWGWLNDDHY